ncbi:hypothetical protein [Bdellovibrio sp. HCB209]|uniref:hypothetical protein n=1 Tax=Bdellovibrio sp. HCB209 TaxID=3394354 RepID=UPI0039B54F05
MNNFTKSLLTALVATNVLASLGFAESTDQECIPEAEYSFILSKYKVEKIDANDEVVKTYSPNDRCESGAFGTYMNAISYLYKLPKAAKIPSRLQTLISKEGPAQFFEKRIANIKYASQEAESCADGAAGFVSGWDDPKDKIMYFCDLKSYAINTPLAASHLLVHEARHIDGHRHVSCERGQASEFSFPACDKTYQEQGSYGIGVGYFFYVYKSTKNEAVRDEARSLAVKSVLINFIKPPLNITTGAIILGEDNVVSFSDGVETFLGSFENDIQTMYVGSDPYLFFKNGEMASYDFNGHWYLQKNTWVSDYYKNLSQGERDTLLDFKSTVFSSCFLWPQYMRCTAGKGIFKEVRFSTINPVRFYESFDIWHKRYQILDDSGKVYVLAEDFEDMMSESDRDYHTTKTEFPKLTGFAMLENGFTYGLGKDGFMMRREPKSTKWMRAKEFKEYKFKKLYPFMWSKTLEDL